MKVLCIHAHFDDFEFACAGLFLLWKNSAKASNSSFQGKILVCTDGAAGHHFRSREETAQLRLNEQAKAAEIGGFEWELLKDPLGNPFREGCLETNRIFLASLWKAIRDYRPDYIVCPPIPRDTRVGIHVDHLQVAEGVRRVAYLISVPHAFAPEFPDTQVKGTAVPEYISTPVILNAHDSYMGSDEDEHDLEFDISRVIDSIAEMSFCHQSQIAEWLPWVGRHAMTAPKSIEKWKHQLNQRFIQRNYQSNIESSNPMEVFTVTAWGVVPGFEKLVDDLPEFRCRSEENLKARLNSWKAS